METRRFWLLVALLGLMGAVRAQSVAAMEKLHARYTADQIADMQQNTHHKYVGMLLFYSASFTVFENGQERAATEAEIRALDLNQYNSLRQEKEGVSVHDATLGLDLRLLSRDDFEKVVLAQLNPADREAYLAYKAQALSLQGKPNQ